jgi:hypothetical protein
VPSVISGRFVRWRAVASSVVNAALAGTAEGDGLAAVLRGFATLFLEEVGGVFGGLGRTGGALMTPRYEDAAVRGTSHSL